MDDTVALQKEAAPASASHLFSDRSCIHLVARLQLLGLVDVVSSRNGKEYVTRDHLVDEIVSALHAQSGRLGLTVLSDDLNVSLTHIESLSQQAMESFKSHHGSAVKVIRGEFITDDYLCSLVDDENLWLQVSASEQQDTLADMAARVTLPADVVRGALAMYAHRLDAQFDARKGTIISYAALRRKRAAMRGKLNGATQITLLDMQGGGGNDDELVDIARDMMEKKEINVRIEGTKRAKILIPKIWDSAAMNALNERLTSDGFMPLTELEKFHVNLTQYRALSINDDDDDDDDINKMRAKHSNDNENMNPTERVFRLRNTLVAPMLYDPLATSTAETIHSDSWLDIFAALPPSFPSDDVAHMVRLVVRQAYQADTDGALMSKLTMDMDMTMDTELEGTVKIESEKTPTSTRRRKSTTGGGGGGPRTRAKAREIQAAKAEGKQLHRMPMLAGQFIVAPKLLGMIRDVVLGDARRQGASYAKRLAEQRETVGSGGGGGGGVIMSKSGVSSTPQQTPSRKGKGGKSKGRRRATSGNGNEKSDQTMTMTNTPAIDIDTPELDTVVALVMQDESCAAALEADYLGGSGDTGEGEDLVRAFFDERLPGDRMAELYATQARMAVELLERERVELKQRAEKRILETVHLSQLTHRWARTLPTEILMNASRRYITKQVCGEVVLREVIDIVARNNGVMLEKHSKNDEVRVLLSEVSERVAPAIQGQLQSLYDSIHYEGDEDETQRDDIDEFVSIYDHVTPILGLPPRKEIDKKSERVTMINLRAQMLGKLSALASVEEYEDASASRKACDIAHALTGNQVLKLCVTALHARLHGGAVIDFPDDDVDAWVDGLCTELAEKDLESMRALATAVETVRECAGDKIVIGAEEEMKLEGGNEIGVGSVAVDKELEREVRVKLAAIVECIGG